MKAKRVVAIYLFIIIILSMIAGAGTLKFYELTNKISPPQAWICNNRIYYVYDFEERDYELHIENTELINICKTSNETNSMDPTIGLDSFVLLIDATPENIEKLKVGDIIIYTKNGTDRIIHRIVSIDNSTGVKEFRLKGDNNGFRDKFIVRPKDIVEICVGILY